MSRKYFNGTGEPFAITVAGEKVYIVTSPQDMGLVFKNTTTLSFDGFVQDIYVAFQMSPGGVKKLWQTHPEEDEKSSLKASSLHSCLFHLGNDIHRAQLHPGEHLDEITAKFLTQIEQGTLWERIPPSSVSLVTTDSKQVSLYGWCAEVLVNAATRTIYGERLLQLSPKLLEDFLIFDADSWKLTYRYPYILAKTMHASRERLTEAFTRYFEIPLDERPGSCYYIRTWEPRQRQAGMNSRDIAIVYQAFHWVYAQLSNGQYEVVWATGDFTNET